MKVKLISVTTPILPRILTAEDLIVYCARVSNPENQENLVTADKLLKYCIDNGHWSIFEQADMTVEIETSRAIAQQILRHKSFSFQEFSQRYQKLDEDSVEEYPARRQDSKNRQNSFDDLPIEDKDWFIEAQRGVWGFCYKQYADALSKGVAKESARFLLPLSTKTRLYMKGSVRSWIHYLQTRLDPTTQLEHRNIALKIQELFIEEFPIVAEALGWSSIIKGGW